MDYEAKQKRLDELVMEALRKAIEEQVIVIGEEDPPVAMVSSWAMVVDTIDTEGEAGTAVLHPWDQLLPDAFKLLTLGTMYVEEDIRAWIRGD